MDELGAIRDFRASVTVPAAARDAARARLDERMEGRRRPRLQRRRLVVALAVVVVAAVAAGTATGLGDWLLDAIRGKPAPRSIQDSFRRYDDDSERIVPIFETRTGVIPERARGVLAVRTSGGVLAIWAAPTRGGGECFELTWFNPGAKGFFGTPGIFGGCRPRSALAGRRVVATIGSHANSWPLGRRHPEVSYLLGQAAPNVVTVELENAGRAVRRVRVFDGYFLTEVTGGRPVDAVVALDRRGRRVGRFSLVGEPAPTPPTSPDPEPLGEPRRLARIQSQGRVFTLDVTRSSGEGRCFELRIDGEIASPFHCPLLGQEPLGTVAPLEQSVPRPPYALLVGEVRPVVRSVEVRYEDGTVDPVPLHDGFVLFVVPREHHTRGRRVAVLVARDADGRIVDRRRLDRRR